VLQKSIHFDCDSSAKSTCGLVLTGTFITFVIPTVNILCCSVSPCVAVCCSVLQCMAVCCSVLQCVAVWCGLWQCVAVCCSTLLQYEWSRAHGHVLHLCDPNGNCTVMQCGAVCRSVLQCCAVWGSVLQCVAVRAVSCSWACSPPL